MGTESERIGGLDHLRRAETPLAIETPDLSRERARESGEIAESTRQELQRLKDRIESGDIDESLIGGLIDAIQDLPPEKLQQKPMILSMLLTSLHKKGIRFGGFENGTVTFLPKGGEEALKYQKHLQDALKNGVFSKGDFQKALLFATSELQAFSSEIQETTNVADYVVSLMNKHGVEYKGVTVSENGETKIPKPSASSYATFRDFLLHRIPDQADSDFLVAYFDDVYYKDGAGFQGNPLSDYKKLIGENSGEFARAFRDLNYEQRQVLGVTTPDDVHDKASQYANNPTSIFSDAIKGGGLHAGAVLGIIGAIFFGKKGFFGGLVLGLLGGLVSPSEAKNFITGLFDAKQSPSYKKYREAVLEKRDGLDKEKTEMLYTALMQNEKFKVKSAKNIYIFQKSSLDQKEFFESCGIWLNDENTPYYKHIFARIIASRKAEGIEPRDEQMIEYLNRKKEQTVVAGAPVPGTGEAPAGGTSPTPPPSTPETPAGTPPSSPTTQTTPPGPGGTPPVAQSLVGGVSAGGAEIIRETDGKILEYFAFSPQEKHTVNSFFERLKARGIEMSIESFLGAYKNYIEQNTHPLYQANLKEATKRRVLDTINGIDLASMEKKEMDDFGTLREFGQNKRIIDTRFDKSFSDFDATVLPTAALLKQILDERGELKPGIQLNEDQQNKLKEAKEMFSSELLEDGRFNNSQILPRWGNITGVFSNEWLVFGAGEQVGEFFAPHVLERGLLSPEDQEIKENIDNWIMGVYGLLIALDFAQFTGGPVTLFTIGGFSAGYDVVDIFASEDAALKMVRNITEVPEDFRMEKGWFDRVLAAFGVIPSLTAVIKGVDLANAMKRFSPKRQQKIQDIIDSLVQKIKLGDEKVIKNESRIQKIIQSHDTKISGLETQISSLHGKLQPQLLARLKRDPSSLPKALLDEYNNIGKGPIVLSPRDVDALKAKFLEDHSKELLDNTDLLELILGTHPDFTILKKAQEELADSKQLKAKGEQLLQKLKTGNASQNGALYEKINSLKFLDEMPRTQRESLKHIFDDLLSGGAEIEINGVKMSKVNGEYIAKKPDGTVIKDKNWLDFMLKEDIPLNPEQIIDTYARTALKNAPEKLKKVNERLAKVDFEFAGKNYGFNINPTNQELEIVEKISANQNHSILPTDPIYSKVMEAFIKNNMPKILARMEKRALSLPMGKILPEKSLKEMYNILASKSKAIKDMGIAGFKLTHLQDVSKMWPPILGNRKEIFGGKFVSTTRKVLLGNSILAGIVSGIGAWSDVSDDEKNEDNFGNDFLDRMIAYNLTGVLFGEIWNQYGEPSSQTGELLTGK